MSLRSVFFIFFKLIGRRLTLNIQSSIENLQWYKEGRIA